MDLSILFTVAAIWAIAAMTPGPNFFITVHTAVEKTRSLSFCTVLGIVSGTLVWAICGYFGVTIIFSAVPVLYYALKIAGGLYLTYIGLCLLFRNKKAGELRRVDRSFSADRSFRLGLMTNLLNPKTAAFMTSLFAATIPPGASVELGVSSIALICLISALWYSLVAAVFSFNRVKRLYTVWQKGIERAAGAMFIYFGVKLAASK